MRSYTRHTERWRQAVDGWRELWPLLCILAGVLYPSSAQAQTTKYAPPIVIFKGGVYRGNWQSLNPAIPAVTVATSQPVTIEYSNIRSRGTLIYSAFKNANLTVRNTRGEALNPNRPLKEYKFAGRFVHLEEFRHAVIQNNELIGTSGIYLREFRGKASFKQTIKIMKNKALNIDGRYSIGTGQYSNTGYQLVQFVQFNQIRGVSNAEISWNEVVNQPGKSRPEEVINMYLSSGTSVSPIKIHNNYFFGAYNVQPTRLPYTGAGMNLGDGSAKTVAEAAGYIWAYDNQLVGTNSGIAMSSGHDIMAFSNRLISSGYLPDGRMVQGQNVGIYIWDYYRNKRFGTFYNVVARNNVIGWATPLRGRGVQNPLWLPDCALDNRERTLCLGNVILPELITQTMERQEFPRWQAKLRTQRVRVGIVPKI